jgi:ABC-type ATPase with predicted acetyltransferase domain
MENKIEWISSINEISTWYCNNCGKYIDDNVKEMEMHECKEEKND